MSKEKNSKPVTEEIPNWVKKTPELLPVWDWWVKDGRSTVTWLLVAGVCVAGWYAFKNWQAGRTAAANTALVNAFTADELEAYGFSEQLDALVAVFAAEYSTESGDIEILFNKDVFVSQRGDYEPKYVTDSVATAGDSYDTTTLTCDNGSVVLVTYEDAASGKTVHFILNYNNYKVNVRVDNTIDKSLADGETKVYTIGRCDFIEFGK